MTKKQAEAKKVIEKKVTKKDTSLMKAKTLLTNNGIAIAENGEVIVDRTVQDFRSAVLVLSLAINLVVFLTWVVLQYTNAYDTALIQAFLIR